jgi:subtilisin family serine protease
MFETCLLANDPSVLVFPGANSRENYFTLHNIKAAQLLSKGNGVKVGILDHSFATELHPKLYAGGQNFVKGNEELLTRKEWHGYWMATVLREIAPEVKIYALNTYVFDGLKARAEAMAKAIDWAIEQKLDILTYSAEVFMGEPRKILDNALDRAHKANIITTFIHTGHPGNILPSGLWSGNDDGREPDVNVLHYDYSVVFIDEYRKAMAGEKTWYRPFFSVSSTSPVVGGVVALMKSLKPGLTPAQCRKILRETAKPMDFEGERPLRVLDALAALQEVKLIK